MQHEAAARAARRSRAVLAFAPSAAATPGDPYAPQYYFDQWHVHHLWSLGADGHGISIAEIDTGVDASLGVFAGRVRARHRLRPARRRRRDRPRPRCLRARDVDGLDHGRPSGAVPDPGTGTGRDADPDRDPAHRHDRRSRATTELPQAIRWAADHGAKVISMSLGGVRRPAQNRTACPDDEQQAIFYALRKGAILFAASGNRGANDDAVEEPGVCLGVVSVGAVDKNGAVASFSSRHRVPDDVRAGREHRVDRAAAVRRSPATGRARRPRSRRPSPRWCGRSTRR